MPDFRVGERVRITHLKGHEHPSWEGMEGMVTENNTSHSVRILFSLNNGETTVLMWDAECLQSVDQDYAEAVRVLGEDYFA